MLRLGGLYRPNSNLTFAADLIVPLNEAPGNFISASLRVGANYKLESGFKVSSGFSYFEDNGFSMSLGIGFAFGENEIYELGIATRDVAHFFSPENPTKSYLVGFLRFRI